MVSTCKSLIIGACLVSMPLISFAQLDMSWGDVPVIGDSYGHKITRDGSFSTGEAVMIQSGWGRDNLSGEVFLFEGCRVGHGNSTSKQHLVVGTDDISSQAAFLIGGDDPVLIEPMAQYTDSYAYGITWDGTRVCGIVANPRYSGFDVPDPDLMRMMYLPVVVDVNPETLEATNLTFLKAPTKDFYGVSPQYCTAVYISDDGKTVVGQVVDNTGFHVYPIVYFQNDNGEWDYKLPSESLFNPDNLEVPKYPELTMDAPQAYDYVIPDKLDEFFEMVDAWKNQRSDIDPYDLLNPATAGDKAFMTQEGYEAYMKALSDYADASKDFQAALDQYYREMAVFQSRSVTFLQNSIAMNNDGSLMAQVGVQYILRDDYSLESHIAPYIFDLKNDSFSLVNDGKDGMQIMQILPDGTLIGARMVSAIASTFHQTYVLSPGSDSYISIPDYVKAQNPEVYQWYEDYLLQDVYVEHAGLVDIQPLLISGMVAVSDDFTAMSGGLDAWAWDLDRGDYYTYFITGMTTPDPAGIDSVERDDDGVVRVYNLQGVKVMETREINDLRSLAKGLYIINGKKIFL